MSYHHDHEWQADGAGSLVDDVALRRAQRRELTAREGRRMLWEGARLVQAQPLGEERAGLRRLRQQFPDRSVPLLCDGPDAASVIRLAEQLLDLGYAHVFTVPAAGQDQAAEDDARGW